MAVEGVEIRPARRGPAAAAAGRVLTDEAVGFVARLHREFGPTRARLLARRAERQAEIDAGGTLDFPTESKDVREADWRVAPPPPDLADRRVEITGPTTPKMVINALNSGARGFMADFEDSNSPTWRNLIDGQATLTAAIERTLAWTSPDGRGYALGERPATLLVRPRGWHLPDKHLLVDGAPVAGAFVDFGLYAAHNARRLAERGSGAYFYLPKLQSHLEARLWNEAFKLTEDTLGLGPGSIACTVLVETLPAAFEMNEILYELRERPAALNAGRWDYMFSVIKTFRDRPEFLLPDRNSVTMTVPFLRAYTELLVRTCHRRGAHAMGGMAAFIPSRKDPGLNEQALGKVRADKRREAGDGFDGTWVAHPDLVPVAAEEFDAVLGDRPNQVARQRDDVAVTAEDLLDVASAFRAGGSITAEGLGNDVNVSIQYLSSWLRGNGAAGIYNLMEDAATAEIARAQVWQWVRHGAKLTDGRTVTAELVRETVDEQMRRVRGEVGEQFWAVSRAAEAIALFERVALPPDFPEFLTLPAYEELD
jgi:malate synthase